MPSRPLTRVLVVDDFEPFRRFLFQTLQKRRELAVVGEASEGLEAVQKAQELRPDLILLDIGLPKLHGIEAAHRIREVSRESKILFVSQESSAAVAQAALDTGARGYVPKSDAGRELVPAIQAVLEGEVFVSSSLAGQVSVNPEGGQPVERQCPDPGCRHEVAFWRDDASLVDGFTRFIEDALKRGHAIIVLATETHRDSLLQKLRVDGVDVAAAVEQGTYIPVDVADVLSRIMVRDLPDPGRLNEVADELLTNVRVARGKQSRVSACGECAPTLLAKGEAEAAIQVERLWTEIAARHGAEILCGYLRTNVCEDEESTRIFERICAEHSAVHAD